MKKDYLLNDQISYEEGKIYWEHCKGYTSDLMKRLMKQGYYAVKEEVVTGYSWEGLLFNTAKLFV